MLTKEKKALLRWRCRRGMLELDLLLERFCLARLTALTEAECDAVLDLLQLPDPDLLACLMGVALPIDEHLRDVVAKVQPYTLL